MAYLGAYIRELISGGLYPGFMSGGFYPGAAGGLYRGAYIQGAYVRGTYIRGDISGGLYSVAYIWAAYIQGAYIPHWYTDSEQVNKRLSPTNSKELHSRFTCPCKR